VTLGPSEAPGQSQGRAVEPWFATRVVVMAWSPGGKARLVSVDVLLLRRRSGNHDGLLQGGAREAAWDGW
jgi:hypothetical protein